MKRKVSIIIYIVFLCTLNMGCSKFLDKKQNDAQRELIDLSDFQAALDVGQTMNNMSNVWRLEASADDFFLFDERYNAYPEDYRAVYIWEPHKYGHSNEWALYYRAVAQTNLVLEGLATIPRTISNQQEWDNVKGSALFYRSFYFLLLTWSHAKAYDEATYQDDLGIPLRTVSDFNIMVGRSDVKDSYQKIIEDATIAAELLPDHAKHVVRPSKAAAYALLARAYLSMRKYEEAYKYADLSLGIKNNLLDFNTDLTGIDNVSPFPEYNKEILFYHEMNSFVLYPGYAQVDTLLYSSYEVNDLRKKAYFIPVDAYHQFKGTYGNARNKYFAGLATDEMLLIRAECLARNNKNAEAIQDMQRLLEHRYESGATIMIPTSEEDLLPFILKERRKELLMRGLRWQDIKRLNKEGANIIPKRIVEGKTYQILPNENRYALPLPNDIIEITGMTQNPS